MEYLTWVGKDYENVYNLGVEDFLRRVEEAGELSGTDMKFLKEFWKELKEE